MPLQNQKKYKKEIKKSNPGETNKATRSVLFSFLRSLLDNIK